MPKKKTTGKIVRKRKASLPQQQPSAMANFIEYLRLGESYTSLVLGIIAVIVATVLLLSFVHNRQGTKQSPEVTPTIAESNSFALSPTISQVPTATKAPTATVTPAPTKVVIATPTKAQEKPTIGGKTYTVAVGDTLWQIAEKTYGSGYNWVDIAKANNLSDPSDIHVGNKLTIPQVAPKEKTVHTADDNLASTTSKITGTTYKIMHGDDLWDIAVRAYGDGYQWTKIAKANHLTDPNLIHVGNTIKIPRN